MVGRAGTDPRASRDHAGPMVLAVLAKRSTNETFRTHLSSVARSAGLSDHGHTVAYRRRLSMKRLHLTRHRLFALAGLTVLVAALSAACGDSDQYVEPERSPPRRTGA